MERELEKDLKETEYLIYVHKNRGNTNTQSVLERVHEIIEPCAKAARTLSELEALLFRENGQEITRSPRDNDVTECCPHCDREITVLWDVEQDGYQIFCPNSGEIIMLCSMCDREPCDWTENGCKYSDERYRDYFRKHMTGGWIPVEDRLPEVGEYVLGTNQYDEVLVYHYGWNSPHTRKMFFHLCGAAADIIAWRPLPEPYRPGETK